VTASAIDPQTPWRSTAREVGIRALAVLGAAAAAAGVWVVWSAFVGTKTGQLLDQAALEGAEFGRTRLWRVAEPVLDLISVPFIAAVLVVAVVVALVRRRWLLAAQVALFMAGANLTAQLLKLGLLDRPDLGVGGRLGNTLPSGHTTAAASCAVALVLVVPRRLRAAVAVAGAVYTAGTGVSTLVGAWHRPGDVVAAVLLVLAWACLVRALGPAGSVGSRVEIRRERSATSLLVAGGLVSGAAAVVAMQQTLAALEEVTGAWRSTGLEQRSELLTAYGGGALGIVAAVCLMFGAVLLLLHLTEPKITASA